MRWFCAFLLVVACVRSTRDAWPQTLAEFSAIHEGWLISVDILAPAIGAQPEVHDLPLVGLVAELRDGGATITVSAARSGVGQITHTIHSPISVSIEQTDAGADVAVEIKSTEGTTTIVRFRTPALPETVDGVAKPWRRGSV